MANLLLHTYQDTSTLLRRAGRKIDSSSCILRSLQGRASFNSETSDLPILPGLLFQNVF